MRTVARRLAARAAHITLTNGELLLAAAALIGYGALCIVFRHTMDSALTTILVSLAHVPGLLIGS